MEDYQKKKHEKGTFINKREIKADNFCVAFLFSARVVSTILYNINLKISLAL